MVILQQHNGYNYLKFLDYRDLWLWDVKTYTCATLKREEGYQTLKEVLKEIKNSVSHEQVRKEGLQIISKINFVGKLFLREFEEINSYKGNLFLVPTGAIIFSKINARHGCIYYNKSKPFVVSSEYPVFKVDETKADGEYLHFALRTKKVKEHLSSKVTGVSKPRLKQDEFLMLPIPIFKLSKQKALINDYYEKVLLAEKQFSEVDKIEREQTLYLNKLFGIEDNVIKETKSLRFIEYKDLQRWGIGFSAYQSRWKITPKYEQIKIGLLCKIGSGGTPNTTIRKYYNGNIPWVKTTEVINGIINDTEDKITLEGLNNSSAKIYPAGSLIIAMYGQGLTRGRTAKLAIDAATNQACAVLHQINNEIILTDFLWIYLMNEYERLRELASGNNQPNLNAGMIYEYKVQVPPIQIQKEVIERMNFYKNKIDIQKTLAIQNKKLSFDEFEKSVFKP